MLQAKFSKAFKDDYRRMRQAGLDDSVLVAVVRRLKKRSRLPAVLSDHALKGARKGYRECHLQSDWLLIYRIDGNALYLTRMGTHADLFGR